MSVIRSGCGTLSRSRGPSIGRVSHNEAAKADSTKVGNVSERFSLCEVRNTLIADVDLNVPYIDVGETSSIGGLLLYTSCKDELPIANIQVGVDDSNPTTVFLRKPNIPMDDDFLVYMGSPSRAIRRIVHWHDDMEDFQKREFLLAKRILGRLIRKFGNPEAAGEIRKRYLIGEPSETADAYNEFKSEVNCILNSKVFDGDRIRIGVYSYATYGGMILSMFLETRTLTPKSGGIPLRLMFLWIQAFHGAVKSNLESRRIGVLNSLYCTLKNRGCYSCLERFLFAELGLEGVFTYPYSYESMILTPERYMGVAPERSFEYEVREHSDHPRDCVAWSFWEHSFLRPAYVNGTVSFHIRLVDDRFATLAVNQHLGMSLIQGLHFLMKGLKQAVMTGSNHGLIESVREKGMHLRRCHDLKELICDLILLSRFEDGLKPLCENTALMIILCVIPKDLVLSVASMTHDVDYYDEAVRYAFGSCIEQAHSLLSILRSRIGFQSLRDRLDYDDIHMTLIHYE